MSSLSVSWQRILTQVLTLRITMKSSSTQFSNADSLSWIRCTTEISWFKFSTLYTVVFPFSWRSVVPSVWFPYIYIYMRHGHKSQKAHHMIAAHCCGVTSLHMWKLHGHKENTFAVLLAVCVLQALPSNGFTCHSIIVNHRAKIIQINICVSCWYDVGFRNACHVLEGDDVFWVSLLMYVLSESKWMCSIIIWVMSNMCNVKGVGQKSGPCTATFNDLLCLWVIYTYIAWCGWLLTCYAWFTHLLLLLVLYVFLPDFVM
jgi:hypothetical protein